MEADSSFTLDDTYVESHAHQTSEISKAYFKTIKDLYFEGMPDGYTNHSMTRMHGSQYLVNTDYDYDHIYWVDIDSLSAKTYELNIPRIVNFFIEGDYMLIVRDGYSMTITRGQQEIGQIEFATEHETCKNGNFIIGRYGQQVGKIVYNLDRFGDLYQIEWQDIKDGKYCKTLVKSNVERFYVDKGLGLATVNVDGTVSLASRTEVDLRQKFDAKTKWNIITCIAKCWIVCGDRDNQAIIACISRKGDIRSKLKLKLASNGFKNPKGMKYGGIFGIRQAFVRGMEGILLVIERDGCCHLISVMYGRMSKLQSVDSIVPSVVKDNQYRVVMSVTATGRKGEFIAGGWNWSKLISLKLK